MYWQVPHVYEVPVPCVPPELVLLELLPPELPLPVPASYAHPFGSSQHVASMHVSPLPQSCPMFATGQ
jgi:hypothetical protein